MRLQTLLSLSLLLILLPVAWAQPADEFFHGGAQLYLSNNIPAAKEAVTNGLRLHPNDEKLKKLYELLNQQQQQDQQNQDKQQQDQNQDQQNQDQNKDQESKNDQDKKDQEKKQQDAKDNKEQQKQDQQQAKPDEKQDEGDPQQVAAHAMTPQEAKQLLDAQKDDEQVLVFQPPGDPKKQDKKLKDW